MNCDNSRSGSKTPIPRRGPPRDPTKTVNQTPPVLRTATHRGPIGLVAGWGHFPIVVAERLKAQGHSVHCVGIKDHADPRLAELCDSFTWCGLTRWGHAIRFLLRHDARQAVMAGKIWKLRLFAPWRWLQYTPDLRTLRALPRILRRDARDDTLLQAVVREFGADGVQFLPATDLVPELLAQQGALTRRVPTPAEQLDIEFGWTMAREMGRLDIGQCVVVKERTVLAVEAIEGTDACIERAGRLCRKGGFTVVKVAKPAQDMRYDVPTVGLGTITGIAKAGGRVLAIEADKSIVLGQRDLIALAERHGIAIVALKTDECGHPAWEQTSAAA